MSKEYERMTPEEALEAVIEENRGKLKIFVGYAPGVGKTYSMLNEANRKFERDYDVVIGYIETHQRVETNAQIKNLPIIPRKKIEYNGRIMEEMDTDEIIKRKPKTVLVDELAHTNVPGSKNSKRYEDVLEILNNGINVMTTFNIQHLESLNDSVFQITGIRVNETLPDRILYNADEVVVVDITPTALQNRLKRGNIYKEENVEQSLKNFFRRGNLNALREIVLRHAAEEVDEELEEYKEEHGIKDNWYTAERIMVCITPNPAARKLLRRGARMARRYKCGWFAVYVNCTRISSKKLSDKDKKVIESHFKLAKELEAETAQLTGKSASKALVEFAFQHHITQIIIGHSRRTFLQKLLRGSTVAKLLESVKDIEVHIIPNSNDFR